MELLEDTQDALGLLNVNNERQLNSNNSITGLSYYTVSNKQISTKISYSSPRHIHFSQEQSIIDCSKADGTYLKAPNGKPTNHTHRQWAQVRTRAFIEWLGDWDAF